MAAVSVMLLLCYQIIMTDALKQQDTSVTGMWTVLKILIYNNVCKLCVSEIFGSEAATAVR